MRTLGSTVEEILLNFELLSTSCQGHSVIEAHIVATPKKFRCFFDGRISLVLDENSTRFATPKEIQELKEELERGQVEIYHFKKYITNRPPTETLHQATEKPLSVK